MIRTNKWQLCKINRHAKLRIIRINWYFLHKIGKYFEFLSLPSTCSEEIWNFVHTLGGIEIISIEALYCVKQIETYTSFHRRMIHMACALPWWCSRVGKKLIEFRKKCNKFLHQCLSFYQVHTIQLAWCKSPILEQIWGPIIYPLTQ